MNIVYYKQIARQLNSLKTKRRYTEKRERRAYLTEAYQDGELALYKPVHKPYRIFTDKIYDFKHKDYPELEMEFSESDDTVTVSSIHKEKVEKPVKLTWFDKFILWIRKSFS
jgi:hypothetical protein